MELSIFLAQLLGLYFLFVGIIFLLRRESLIPTVKEFGAKKALILVLALLELAAGLALVVGHPIYTLDWRGIITFIGAWMVIESLFFIIMPNKLTKKLIDATSSQVWYVGGGLIAIAIGAYLAGIGFAII